MSIITRRQFGKAACVASLAGIGLAPAHAKSENILKVDASLEDLQKRIENKMKKWLKKYQVPGLSLSLLRNGKSVWAESYGVKEIVRNERVDSTTVFEAASLTKPITAFVALTLSGEGSLDLELPLLSYLDRSDRDGIPDGYLKITAQHVLCHSSGLPNWRIGAEAPKVNFEPGDRFSYSGEGYVLLQEAMQRITGKQLDVLCRERIFDPLGMKQSSLIWKDGFEHTLAFGYAKKIRKGVTRSYTTPNAASSLVSSPNEYSLFLEYLFGAGMDQHEAPDDRVLQKMMVPQVDVRPGISWGLGWGLQSCEGENAFWHWGNNGNRYHSFVIGYPEHGLGLVVMANSGNGLPLCQELVPEIIGGCHPALDWRMVVG